MADGFQQHFRYGRVEQCDVAKFFAFNVTSRNRRLTISMARWGVSRPVFDFY